MPHLLLTSAEAARRLNVTPATVRLMARNHVLAVAVQTGTGVRLFDESAVETLRLARLREQAPGHKPARGGSKA